MKFLDILGFCSAIGCLLGIGYWFLDAAVMSFFFHEGIFSDLTFNPSSNDIWMRSVTILFIVIFGVGIDIYSFKIRKSEERFGLAVKGANDGLWDWDIESGNIWWSPRFYELLGYKDGELESTYDQFLNFLHPEDKERVLKATRSHHEQRLPYDIEYRLQTKSGEYRWVQERGQALWDKNGKPVRMAGSIRDITEHKQAEEALREEHQLLSAVIDVPSDMIYVKDIEGRFILANPTMAKYFGTTVEEIIGKTNAELFPTEERTKQSGIEDREVLSTGKSFNYERTEEIKGTIQTRLSTKSPYRDGEGKIIGVIGISRNITERKQAQQVLLEREAMLTDAARLSNLGYATWSDEQHCYLSVSEEYARIFGYSADEFMRRFDTHQKSLNLFHPEDRAQLEASCFNQIKTDDVRHYELRIIRQDKQIRHIKEWKRPVKDSAGKLLHTLVITQDVTDIKRAGEELRKSQALYSEAERMGKLGHWEWDEITIALSSCSEQYARIFEMSIDEILAVSTNMKDDLQIIHPDDREFYSHEVMTNYEQGEQLDIEYRIITRTGAVRHVHELGQAVLDEHGKLVRTFGTLQDITERKRAEEQLSYQACHDDLTGLVNRREFERRTERLLSTIKQVKTEHALCYMDLDQFKVVNDTCGHAAGDEMLRQLSSLLQDTVRHRDTLARLGGDEFGLLMEHCSLDHAHRVAESLLKAVQDYQFIWEEHTFRVGVSIGLIAITEAVPNLSELLKHADAACYMAKDSGRNRIHVYHPDDAVMAQRYGEMQWVGRIYQALEEHRFCLYAQPIVPLDGSTDTHYELLLRMEDEKGQFITPGAFLPAAERYNLIAQLDAWVIENAFRLLAENPVFLKQIQFISINLSGQSLTKHDSLDFIISQLDAYGIEGEKICFEITETAAISNLSTASKFISTLKELGCRFALDNFGSGLSSFSYLKNLPVDYLKIDGMFVRDIVDDPIDHAMVKSINEIGQVMGMQTIAEFVENDEIKGMLREIGVNYAQGYGIGKPIAFDELLGRSNNVADIKDAERAESVS